MKYVTIVTTLTIIFASILSGCDSPYNELENSEVSMLETNRDIEVAKSELQSEVHIYRNNNAYRIREYNLLISDIKKEIEEEPDSDEKEKLEKKIGAIETYHRSLKREIDNYNASEKEKWENFKVNFTERMDIFGDSLRGFFIQPYTNPKQ